MIKAVVFDFDGTLADTLMLSVEAGNEVGRELGLRPLDERDIERLREMDVRELVTKELHLPMYRLPFFVKRIQGIIRGKTSRIRFYNGMKQVVRRIAKNHQVIILTSSPEDIVRKVLEKERIGCIKTIFSGRSLFGKHVMIGRLLKKYRLKREEIVYVGDEVRDIVACRKAGVRIISVSWGFNSRKRLISEKPDFIADKPDEILKIVGKKILEMPR